MAAILKMTATADECTFAGAPISKKIFLHFKVHVYKIWCFYQKVNDFLSMLPHYIRSPSFHFLKIRTLINAQF
jgi:hypothetical protein